jgi:plasmid stabilization system protein ParE
MSFRELLAEDAERDIENIYRYIARHDSVAAADRVIGALDDACRRLADLPERGNVPKNCRPSASPTIVKLTTSHIASSTGSSDVLSSFIAWSTAGETCSRFLRGGFYADRPRHDGLH